MQKTATQLLKAVQSIMGARRKIQGGKPFVDNFFGKALKIWRLLVWG